MRTELRNRFLALVEQWRRYSDRVTAAYDAQDTEAWADLDAAAARSGAKFVFLRDELADYCGASAAFITELLTAVIAAPVEERD